MRRRERTAKLRGPFTISAIAHAAALTALVIARPSAPAALPPIYKVDLVAAPPGPRAIGAVTPPPPAAETPPATPPAPPRRAEVKPSDMPLPEKRETGRKPPPPATPTTTKAPPNAPVARAGGGPEGGRGTDVANVRTEGMQFPFPGYLENIVRQIAINFKPRSAGALRAEVFFIIERDGSVKGFRFITRSGNLGFDLEAQGAVEAAASSRAFGPLPDGFTNDFLPVIFSFDPMLIR